MSIYCRLTSMNGHMHVDIWKGLMTLCLGLKNYVWFFKGVKMECYFCVWLWARENVNTKK